MSTEEITFYTCDICETKWRSPQNFATYEYGRHWRDGCHSGIILESFDVCSECGKSDGSTDKSFIRFLWGKIKQIKKTNHLN